MVWLTSTFLYISISYQTEIFASHNCLLENDETQKNIFYVFLLIINKIIVNKKLIAIYGLILNIRRVKFI